MVSPTRSSAAVSGVLQAIDVMRQSPPRQPPTLGSRPAQEASPTSRTTTSVWRAEVGAISPRSRPKGSRSPSPQTRPEGSAGPGSRAAQIAANTAALRSAFVSGGAKGMALPLKHQAPISGSPDSFQFSPHVDRRPAPPLHTAEAGSAARAKSPSRLPLPKESVPGSRIPSSSTATRRAQPLPTASTRSAHEALNDLRDMSEGETSNLQCSLHSAARREELLRGTVSSQIQALADKDDVIQALRSRLAIAAAKVSALEEGTRPSDGSGGTAAQQLSEENAALVAANRALEARVRELESQAVRQREEMAALRRLALEMQARKPDVARAVEAAVQGEHALQEERNRRALELLTAKDAAVKAAEVKVGHVAISKHR